MAINDHLHPVRERYFRRPPGVRHDLARAPTGTPSNRPALIARVPRQQSNPAIAPGFVFSAPGFR